MKLSASYVFAAFIISAESIRLRKFFFNCFSIFIKKETSASNFQKCNRKRENFKSCVLKAAIDGIRELDKGLKEVNLPSLDPLEILEMSIKAGKQTVAVDQNFKNCRLYGLNKIQLTIADFRFQEKELYAEGVLPEIKKECEYELNEKVLLLPIVGQGPSTIVLKNVNVTLHIPFDEVQTKDKTYLKFHSNKLTLDPNLVTFNFENLFNGDKQLGDNINKVLNDNWKEVFVDVKDGYEKTLGIVAEDLFNRFFSKVSVKEAFD